MDVISLNEILLIAFVALLVIGPERLPEVLRTLGLWWGRLRRSFVSVKTEIEKEIGMDEIRRQLHNEAVMDEMKRIEQEVKESIDPHAAPRQETAQPSEAAPEDDPAPDPSPDVEPEPAPPTPRSEAELEAFHEAKRKKAEREQ